MDNNNSMISNKHNKNANATCKQTTLTRNDSITSNLYNSNSRNSSNNNSSSPMFINSSSNNVPTESNKQHPNNKSMISNATPATNANVAETTMPFMHSTAATPLTTTPPITTTSNLPHSTPLSAHHANTNIAPPVQVPTTPSSKAPQNNANYVNQLDFESIQSLSKRIGDSFYELSKGNINTLNLEEVRSQRDTLLQLFGFDATGLPERSNSASQILPTNNEVVTIPQKFVSSKEYYKATEPNSYVKPMISPNQPFPKNVPQKKDNDRQNIISPNVEECKWDELKITSQNNAKPVVAEQNNKKLNIIVVGAGIAGIAAAHQLAKLGHKVTVLEARNRIGGRIHTQFGEINGCDIAIDMGATCIFGMEKNQKMGNPLYKVCTDAELTPIPLDIETVLYKENGELVPKNAVDQSLTKMSAVLRELQVSRAQKGHSFLAAIKKNYTGDPSLLSAIKHVTSSDFAAPSKQLAKRVFFWRVQTLESTQGAAAETIPFLHWGHNTKEEFKGPAAVLKQGLHKMVDSLNTSNFAINLGCVVTSISHRAHVAEITTSDSRVFKADRILITLPLGVLKQKSIQFIPPLPPWKTNAISRLCCSTVNRVALVFKNAFWDNATLIGNIDEENPIYQFLNYHKYTNQPVLLGFIKSEQAVKIEELSDKEVVNFAMKFLKAVYGAKCTAPTQHVVSRWSSDPFARGSHSSVCSGATASDFDILAMPVGEKLFFAGEATSHQRHGSVVGAFESGTREAFKIHRQQFAKPP